MPSLYIIAGCNGSGKTTASYTILPEILKCKEFVNADEIASGLSPFQPEKTEIEAGRIMLQRIDYLIKKNIDFAFETTLAARNYVNTIKYCKTLKYRIVLIFLWLPDYRLAVERIKKRVKAGGHNIPITTVKRRFYRGIKNLLDLYLPLSDYWIIIDNSHPDRQIIAEGNNTIDLNVLNIEKWKVINDKQYKS